MASLETTVASELVTLGATAFEITTHVCAVLIDRTRVRVFSRAVEHTTTTRAHLECLLPKMPGLKLADDLRLTALSPSIEVAICHEDGSCALETAGTTRQAV
ncbi:MAG TPA: hypothetical protein VKP30_21245 [Polyangiaceae bacterium]|nr:hypothetical protein [Polyangiaceae bacterium]